MPKPKGYPRIEFPDRMYRKAPIKNCPFTFEIPNYTSLEPVGDLNKEPCWYNLYFKPFDAILHLSYKEVNTQNKLEEYIEDSRELVFKHTIKAQEIEEREIDNKKNIRGIFYDIKGETATSINFFVSDYNQHFLRGAFYFNEKTKIDSVQPIVDFVKNDFIHLIETLQWK